MRSLYYIFHGQASDLGFLEVACALLSYLYAYGNCLYGSEVVLLASTQSLFLEAIYDMNKTSNLHVLNGYEAECRRIRIEHYRSEDLLIGFLVVSFEGTAAF